MVETVQEKLDIIPGYKGEAFRAKLKAVLGRNPGYEMMSSIGKILSGENVAKFKFCPLVTADVERSFSKYKLTLSDKQMNLSEENISKMMVVNWFYNQNSN